MKHAEKVNIVTPDWVTDSIKKETKVDESIYHPRLIVYPEPEPPTPPTPPATPPQEKIPTPPLPQPMDTSEPQTMPILDRANMGLPRPNFADFSERVQKGRVRPDKSPRRSPGHQDSAGRNMSKQVISQQLAAAVLERRLSNEDKGISRPDTPGSSARPGTPSGTAREALARMVNNRIQVCLLAASLHDMHVTVTIVVVFSLA